MDTLKWVFVGLGIFFGLLFLGGLIYWLYTMFSPTPQSSPMPLHQDSYNTSQALPPSPVFQEPSQSSSPGLPPSPVLPEPSRSSSQALPPSPVLPEPSQQHIDSYESIEDDSDLYNTNDLNKYTSSENQSSLKTFGSIDDYLPSLDTFKSSSSSNSDKYSYTQDRQITGGIKKPKRKITKRKA
jgi:hypothetical protein